MSIVFLRPMIRSFRRASRSLGCLVLVLAIAGETACNRAPSPEEKATRAELRKALRERSYPKAVELAQRVVGSSPHDDGAWARLVRAHIGMRDLAEAKQTIVEWRSTVRNPSPKLDELAGDIANEEGNVGLALDSWSKALAATPKNPRVLNKVARAQRSQQHWAKEEAALSAIIDIKDDATTRIERALCRRRQHRWTDAIEDYRRAREMAPDDPDVRRGARVFERLGKFLAEIRKLDARLAIRPTDDQLLTDRALLFLRSEDAELALHDARNAAAMAPWTVRPKLFQAIALIDLNRTAECEQLGVDPRLRLDALPAEFLETISRLDAEISVERNNAELYVTRAWHLNEIAQPTLALQDAQTASQHDAKLAAAHIESSYALTKLGRTDEAFEAIKRATELGGSVSTAWQYRGELEMTRGDHVAAIESLSRALALEQLPVALQKRAECYRQVGLMVKADEDQRALEKLNAQSIP